MKIHKALQKKYNNWSELEKVIEAITETTEKGDVFEQFCYFYFLYFKDLYQIEELYSPKIEGKGIPKAIETKLQLSHKDDGVDGVFVTRDGKYTAYQAKFRSHRRSPASNELNNFWAEAEYADNRLVIANCVSLPKDVFKRKSGSSVLVDKLDALDSDFFDYLYKVAQGDITKASRKRLSPKDFQKPIISSAVTGFKTVDRGKIIAACATGKTLISMWISEKMHSDTVLFFAPNLSLIRQSIERWTSNANIPFQYLAVCSDNTVSDKSNDSILTQVIDLDVPVTTEPEPIQKFLTNISGKRVIFSTYQSVECIVEALKGLPDFKFDLAIYDEAHRTAGKVDDGLFNIALNDKNVPISKRLFMTATERLVKPWVKDRLEKEEITVFSMDDETVYGPVFYKYSFGQAIKEKVISDYQLVISGTDDKEINVLVETNRYLKIDDNNDSSIGTIDADTLYKAILLGKAVKETGMKKVVSYHSNIDSAKSFVKVLDSFGDDLLLDQFGIDKSKSAFLHVNGTQSTSERSACFKEFEDSGFGLMSNVRCLTEGVDIPYIDGILFSDNKNSMIDIVQAVGRALRKPQEIEDKTAYIVIPIKFDEDGLCSDEDFAPLHFVIQALRDQDDTLAEWIDEINLGVVKGKGGHSIRKKDAKISLLLPKKVNVEDFANRLAVRISTVNSKATGQVGLGSTLGKKQRNSEYKRIFKSIGDYNRDKYKESLVDPTLARFVDESKTYSRADILVNNNNVSHCERLGVIKKVAANEFALTDLGRKYKEDSITFDQLFQNQMLLYTLDEGKAKLFPYRFMLKVLIECSSLNYIEFLYSVYSAQANDEELEISRAMRMLQYIRLKYPNVVLTSPGNQEDVRVDLNDQHGVGFSERDVWTDRTTSGNQYRFILNHLMLFSDYLSIEPKSKVITVKDDQIEGLKALLDTSKEIYMDADFVYGDTLWLPECEGIK